MYLILTHIWIVFIVFTVVKRFYTTQQAKTLIDERPELEKGYNDMFRAIVIIGNIPWIIAGIGMLAGLTKNMSEFSQPKQLNPIVLAFHASIVTIYFLTIRWIYFRNGAQFLVDHPTFFNRGFSINNMSINKIKILFALMMLGGVFALCQMWLMHFPVSNVR